MPKHMTDVLGGTSFLWIYLGLAVTEGALESCMMHEFLMEVLYRLNHQYNCEGGGNHVVTS